MRDAARGASAWLALAVALVLLNSALTFENHWPTPLPRLVWPPGVSIELALVLLALVAWTARGRRLAADARVATALAATTLAFALVRYGIVTAPALYGRPVDLYWDAPHVGNVARMLAAAAGPLPTVGALLATGLVLVALYALLRAAWGRVLHGLARPAERRTTTVLAAVVLAAGIVDLAGVPPGFARVTTPVVASTAAQLRLVADGWRGAREAPVDESATDAADAPKATADPRFHALAGDDVLLVFVESYGSVAWTNPAFAARLAGPRAGLARAVADTGRAMVSATVVAPTFGGNSWLSHASLLAGTAVRDPGRHARVLKSRRPTLVHAFERAGYRSVALMPGLRQAWPEGAFYGFDTLLDARTLDYRGPEFGWWRIPDQYALAALDAKAGDGGPRFVFFPTITSHAPFRPTPPYQRDWSRLLGAAPYGPEAAAALALAPDWTELAPAYGDTLAYVHEWLAGWLTLRAAADVTLVVLGDHQPPAAVAGPNADWSVPVHVISRRAPVLESLRAAGFVTGLVPPRTALGELHELRAPLLRAFRDATAVAPAARAGSAEPARVDVAGRTARPAVEQPPPQRAGVQPLG